MNKNGFLLGEETLKIIIAVICIGFLVYLLTALYFSVSGEQKSKEAQASISILSSEVSKIQTGGESNAEGILIPNPSEWYLFSFTGESKKPNSCTNSNCLCICGNVLIDLFERQIKQCDEKGACILVQDLSPFNKIKINKGGSWISVQKINNEISVRQK